MSNNLSQTQLSDLQELNLRLKNMQDKILREEKKNDTPKRNTNFIRVFRKTI